MIGETIVAVGMGLFIFFGVAFVLAVTVGIIWFLVMKVIDPDVPSERVAAVVFLFAILSGIVLVSGVLLRAAGI